MIKQPTKKQAALLKFIEDFTSETGKSPTYREIAAALKLSSVSAVAEHINNCVKAGFLTKNPKEARSLEVVKLEKYEETTKLFKQAIAELKDKIDSSGNETTKAQYKDDLLMLRGAASILGLDLS